ncbi:MAG: cation diffusion facilitator family transporter [Rhodospirillales bacterium]|nr:cation diffusion facilitator family transporter [Rhodospirillales bacterium]
MSDVSATSEHGNRLKRRAAVAAVAVAGVLIVAKAVAWFMTGSMSILSTLIDSMLDLAASVVNLVAVRQAIQPADREHRFGHGKAEPLAGLAQAAFISGSVLFLLFEAGSRLFHPRPIERSEVGLAVMALSIVLTVALVLYQRHVVRRTRSVAISADSLHYATDVLTNGAVVLALVLSSQFGWTLADPLFAIAVGLIVLRGVWEILNGSLNQLMDRELPQEDRDRIRAIAQAHPGVIGMHDLRTRAAGSHAFIQLHLEMEGSLTLLEAHSIAEAVMAEIEAAYPTAEVLIHEDPHGVPEPRAVFN